jgi:hypothetical protein
MNKETIVKYSFTILEEYQDLENGTPNFHYCPAITVSNQGTMEQFLDSMQKNSKIKGLSIVDINFEIINP